MSKKERRLDVIPVKRGLVDVLTEVEVLKSMIKNLNTDQAQISVCLQRLAVVCLKTSVVLLRDNEIASRCANKKNRDSV